MQQFIFNTAQTNASQSSLMYPCSTIWEWACTLFALLRFAWARVSWCYMPNIRLRIAFCNWQNMTSTVLDLSVIKNNMAILHYISLYCQGHVCIIHWDTLWEGQAWQVFFQLRVLTRKEQHDRRDMQSGAGGSGFVEYFKASKVL